MIIDFHTHCFPDEIAERTIPRLAGIGNIKNNSDGTQNGLIHSMKEAGINYSLLLPIATKPSQTEKLNHIAAETNRRFRETGLISFGSVHPDNSNYRELLKQAASMGIKGIKLHPYYQQVNPDDIRVMRIVETNEELGMMTIFHAGLDVGFDGCCYAGISALRKLYDTILPKRLILAHMGGWKCWDEVEEMLAGLPIYFDTSFCLGKTESLTEGKRSEEDCLRLSNRQFLSIVKKHGAEHILFGSDSPWSSQKEALRLLDSSGLEKSQLKLIKGENAKSLLSL